MNIEQPKRRRLLCDVDGVVADLMGGFVTWLWSRYRIELEKSDITRFHIAKSPELQELHRRHNLDDLFDEFMAEPDLYSKWCLEEAGAVNALAELQTLVDVTFITATMRNIPQSFEPKARWLMRRWPNILIISCPSSLKHLIRCDYAVDDRWDTCERFVAADVDPFCFQQPWSEMPLGFKGYDWPNIVAAVREDLET